MLARLGKARSRAMTSEWRMRVLVDGDGHVPFRSIVCLHSVPFHSRVVFKFKSSKRSNNGTDIGSGQIPEILYRFAVVHLLEGHLLC